MRKLKQSLVLVLSLILVSVLITSYWIINAYAQSADYVVVDTGQTTFYDNSKTIALPQPGEPFHGQDAQYKGTQPSYQDNGDGTVTDLVTGLMWQKSPDRNGNGVINYADKLFFDEALDSAASFNLAGHNDWRLRPIKAL